MDIPSKMSPPVQKRRANFSDSELNIIINEVIKRKKVILGRFDASLSSKAKEIAWQDVAKVVNATCPTVRIPKKLQK